MIDWGGGGRPLLGRGYGCSGDTGASKKLPQKPVGAGENGNYVPNGYTSMDVSDGAIGRVEKVSAEPFSASRTSNWVARGGGLPHYIQHVAHDLMEERGKSESQAIQMAIGICKRWAAGGGNVKADTRAKAAAAVAEWEALKAKAHFSKAEGNTGCMVALYPDKKWAEDHALKGGEPVDALHMTLTFHGKAAKLHEDSPHPDAQAAGDKLKSIVGQWAAKTPPMHGELSGAGLFTAGPEPVTYLTPDLPDLPHARAKLVTELHAAGLSPRMDHGFSPHVTLDYKDRMGEVGKVGGHPVAFTHATVVLGDEHTHFPLVGSSAVTKAWSDAARAASIAARKGHGLSPAQLGLFHAIAKNPGKVKYHRSIGKLQNAHIEVDGNHFKRSDKSFQVLLSKGFVDHKPFKIGDAGHVPAWTTPKGREVTGIAKDQPVSKAVLDAAARKKLPTSAFALPGGRYPIHDLAHARAALARVAQHGTPEEQSTVKGKVYARYPELRPVKKAGGLPKDWRPPTAEELAILRAKTPKASGVSLKYGPKGYCVHTHRARSKWYPTVQSIPVSAIEFVESTG